MAPRPRPCASHDGDLLFDVPITEFAEDVDDDDLGRPVAAGSPRPAEAFGAGPAEQRLRPADVARREHEREPGEFRPEPCERGEEEAFLGRMGASRDDDRP